jgi:hypothetical protein
VKRIPESIANFVDGPPNFAANLFSTMAPIVTAAPHVLPRIAQAAPNFLASAFHFPPHLIPNPS